MNTEYQIEESLIKEGKPLVIDFYAEWCGPCKVLKSSIENLKEKYPQINFLGYDVNTHEDKAKEYGIRNLPTLIFFKGGKEVSRITGALTQKLLEIKLKRVYEI